MKKSRAEFGAGRDMALVAHREPHFLQGIDIGVVAFD